MLNNKKFRSILCLNGDLPDKAFFQRNLPIIAADGAFLKLQALKINPDMVIGDFDSVDRRTLRDFPHQYDPDQSFSDFQKCLKYMEKENLLPAIIVGIQGGFIDHVLHNVNIFTQTDSLFYAPPVLGFTIKAQEKQRIITEVGAKISLMGLPSAMVHTQGLKWDINHENLVFPGKNSCFNRANQPFVDISVQSGCALILLYDVLIKDAGW